MGIDTMQEAPLALAGYWVWISAAGALLLFGFGWFLCAKIKSRKIGAIEEQTERRVSKLVEKADREKKRRFLRKRTSGMMSKRITSGNSVRRGRHSRG